MDISKKISVYKLKLEEKLCQYLNLVKEIKYPFISITEEDVKNIIAEFYGENSYDYYLKGKNKIKAAVKSLIDYYYEELSTLIKNNTEKVECSFINVTIDKTIIEKFRCKLDICREQAKKQEIKSKNSKKFNFSYEKTLEINKLYSIIEKLEKSDFLTEIDKLFREYNINIELQENSTIGEESYSKLKKIHEKYLKLLTDDDYERIYIDGNEKIKMMINRKKKYDALDELYYKIAEEIDIIKVRLDVELDFGGIKENMVTNMLENELQNLGITPADEEKRKILYDLAKERSKRVRSITNCGNTEKLYKNLLEYVDITSINKKINGSTDNIIKEKFTVRSIEGDEYFMIPFPIVLNVKYGEDSVYITSGQVIKDMVILAGGYRLSEYLSFRSLESFKDKNQTKVSYIIQLEILNVYDEPDYLIVLNSNTASKNTKMEKMMYEEIRDSFSPVVRFLLSIKQNREFIICNLGFEEEVGVSDKDIIKEFIEYYKIYEAFIRVIEHLNREINTKNNIINILDSMTGNLDDKILFFKYF